MIITQPVLFCPLVPPLETASGFKFPAGDSPQECNQPDQTSLCSHTQKGEQRDGSLCLLKEGLLAGVSTRRIELYGYSVGFVWGCRLLCYSENAGGAGLLLSHACNICLWIHQVWL